MAALWSVAAAVAFVASYVGVRLTERAAPSLGLIDLPNARSSHRAPRPRGGGLGLVAGACLGALAAVLSGSDISGPACVVLGAATVLSALGLADDIRSLSAGVRLIVQAAVSVAVVATLGGLDRLPLPAPLDVPLGMAGTLVAVVWLVGVTNFFNFMDGVDGLAAGQAIISFGVLASMLQPDSAAGPAIIATAASAGFIFRNWSPARIFLGDVGSSFLGFLLAALPFAAPVETRGPLVLLVATSLTLFLLDPVATLIARARRGAQIGAAHREHAYQRLIPPDRSHAPAVVVLLLTGLALSLAAAAAYRHPTLAWPSIGLAVSAFGVQWRMAARR